MMEVNGYDKAALDLVRLYTQKRSFLSRVNVWRQSRNVVRDKAAWRKALLIELIVAQRPAVLPMQSFDRDWCRVEILLGCEPNLCSARGSAFRSDIDNDSGQIRLCSYNLVEVLLKSFYGIVTRLVAGHTIC